MLQIFRYLWASPGTLIGLPFVLAARLSGGRVQVVSGVVEACGGVIPWCLSHFLICRHAAAITLGHVVLAVDEFWLDETRAHERVHVRQYEQWGPLFIPAYLGASAVLYLRGANPYYDNPFEKAAYKVG